MFTSCLERMDLLLDADEGCGKAGLSLLYGLYFCLNDIFGCVLISRGKTHLGQTPQSLIK